MPHHRENLTRHAQAAVREKLAQAGRPDTKSDERSALRAELDSLRGQSSDSKLSRDKISEEIKNLQDSIQKQVFVTLLQASPGR